VSRMGNSAVKTPLVKRKYSKQFQVN